VWTAVECPVPKRPAYGYTRYTSVQYNSIVSYACNHGYMLVGNETRKCEADKRWSGDDPQCKGTVKN
jgi:CUB/sushi domain-containing protein